MELVNKVALVTGGARGIGRGVAESLARAGADLVIADLCSEPALAEEARVAVAAVEAHGRKAIAVDCDVTSEAACNSAVESARSQLGGLDVVVCNAGIMGMGGVRETSLEQWERVFRVNTTGPFLMARAAVPHFVEQGSGVIVNMASVLGLRPSGKRVSYSASKAALIALTRSLADDLAPHGIRVNCICPSSVRSAMTVSEVQEATGAEDLEAADAMWSRISTKVVPLGRSLEPDDIGRAVVWLCESDMVTGVALPVTGGDGG